MKTIHLIVPNMKSNHCQNQVSAIVRDAGAQVISLEPGKVEIGLPDESLKRSVVQAIQNGGYPVNEMVLSQENSKSQQFKTTIKCSGCAAKAATFLNEVFGPDNWEVDYNHPSKILTIKGNVDKVNVIRAVEEAGFKAESI